MTYRRLLNVSAWNLAFVSVGMLACQEPPDPATDGDGGGSSGLETGEVGEGSIGESGDVEPGCETDACTSTSTSSSTGSADDDTGDTTGSLDRCEGDEDCNPGSLCEVYDDGYTTMPYADCWGYDIYDIDPCAEVSLVPSMPLPSPGAGVVSLSFVDVDGDGSDDLIAGHEQGASVLYGPGTGGFEPLPLPAAPVISTASADFDGDGLGDIAALSDDGQLTILSGQAGGSWSVQPGPNAAGVDRVFALDFDGGDGDLALFDADASTLAIWTSDGGVFSLSREEVDVQAPVSVGSSTESPYDAFFHASALGVREVFVGSSDQLVLDRRSASMGSAQLDLGPERPAERVLTSYHSDWTLIHIFYWSDSYDRWFQFLPFVAERPQAADLDGDGREELVLETPTGLAVLAADPVGSGFACYLHLTTATGSPWALGDFDGDGRATVVSADGVDLEYQSLPPDGTLTPQ